jgi:hypothetical protein
MNITRNNYEEFFMLYADGELSAADRKEVEAFIAANPDMHDELALFQQFKLQPDATIVFDNKASLLKSGAEQANITIANCESFFVLYADDELANAEKTAVNNFVYQHPQLQETFELLQQAKLHADTSTVFKNKETLYRKEEDDKVIPFPWWRLAAAAAVILFVSGLFWMSKEKKIGQTDVTVIKNAAVPVRQPVLQTKKDTATDQNNKNEQPVRQTIAKRNPPKENPVIKNMQPANAVAAAVKKEIKRNKSKLAEQSPLTQQPVIKEDVADVTGKNDSKRNNITTIKEEIKNVDTKPSIAAAVKVMPDQPSIILHPDENEETKTSYVSLNNDNVEVLNTSVNTKSSLRGFLRKATRLIAKKTNTGSEADEHKSILIGGFAIAVR